MPKKHFISLAPLFSHKPLDFNAFFIFSMLSLSFKADFYFFLCIYFLFSLNFFYTSKMDCGSNWYSFILLFKFCLVKPSFSAALEIFPHSWRVSVIRFFSYAFTVSFKVPFKIGVGASLCGGSYQLISYSLITGPEAKLKQPSIVFFNSRTFPCHG